MTTRTEDVLARAIPLWALDIRQHLEAGLPTTDIMATAIDTGRALHVRVFARWEWRLALDAVGPGLASEVLDEPDCPPAPFGLVVLKHANGSLSAVRYPLQLQPTVSGPRAS